jgi:hypothetical protein
MTPKRFAVSFLTNGKVIQAFLTGSTFGVLNRLVDLVSRGVAFRDVPLSSWIGLVLMALMATLWFWIDRHQAWFEAFVEDAAGEE